MTETLVAVTPSENANDKAAEAVTEVPAEREVDELEVARELVRQARDVGVALTGPDGLLKAITKTVIETALDEELSEHLGYDKHDREGHGSGNSHNGTPIAMRATADLIAAASSDRLTGVRVIGVDEHRWALRRVGPAGFVTLIIDLTPTHDQTGPVRPLDLVEGRSATALASWLAAQPSSFAQAVEVIAMDGFAGYKTAATEASAYRRWCTSVVVREGAVVRVSTVTWTRVMMVLAVVVVTAAVVAVVRVVLNRDGGSAPAVAPLETSDPVPVTSPAVPTAAVAPPPPGFPDLDGFTDVSQDHDVSRYYPLATFTSPTGLQCAMWSSRGDTAAFCFGAIPGLDHPANQVYAGDYKASFDQNKPPDTDKLNGKPLASGEKVILGAGGNLMGDDQITCGVQDLTVACMVIRGFRQNHGDDTAQRHGFVLSPQTSWTF